MFDALTQVGCFASFTLIAFAPVGLAGLSWARRRPRGRARPWLDRLAILLLWVTFNTSFAAIWGATAARPAGSEVALPLLATLLLAQPAALALCAHVVRARRRESSEPPNEG